MRCCLKDESVGCRTEETSDDKCSAEEREQGKVQGGEVEKGGVSGASDGGGVRKSLQSVLGVK